nr:hypothetical protein [Tanacetum cinerariifolium]
TINDLNQTISEMKDKLYAHQETISILSQQKEARIKLYKTREDKELDKIIALENKEKRMDESIPLDKKCQSSIEIFKVKTYVNTILNGVELCKEKIANRTYSGYIDPFIQNTIEAKISLVISRINAGLEQFYRCLNEEMVDDLRYFNSLELEVDSLKSQLETQKTQFLNEIDRLSREYYYADHINAILGLETELSKSQMMSKSFEALQKHAINLEIYLQQCQEKIKNDKSFIENLSKEFRTEHEQYFEIQDLKAQLQDKGIVISELKKLIEKLKGKSVNTKFEKSSVIRQPNAFKSQRPSILGNPTTFLNSFERKDFSKSKFDNNVSFEEELVYQRFQKTLTHVLELSSCIYLDDRARGFRAQSNSSSNTIALDSPYLLILNTEASQSRQHGFSFVTVNTKEYHSECSGNYHEDNA